ncbi:MAG: hypothetical protein AB1813_22305 [Verrucomicrobiota bacterium]|jgi:hypothetical protein
MRRFYCLVVLFGWIALLGLPSLAGEYKLLNGDIIRGDPAGFNEDGVSFRLDIGGFSPRISWGKFTQESLKEIAKDSRATRFAEPFIEIPPEVKQRQRAEKKDIPIKPVPRVERPEKKIALGAAFATPAGVLVLIVLFIGNLYAAYEVAVFRHRPIAMVCGISVILPILGPLFFLAMPTLEDESMAEGAAPEAEAAATVVNPMAATGTGSSLSIASAERPGPSGGAMEQATYKRGDTTFNRRFFETKFPGFFRVVPSEAEKDLVLVVRTPKAEYVAKRISRISSNEMHLQLLRGATEVSVSFGEITEVQVRHKDAKH